VKNWFGMESHPSDSLIHFTDVRHEGDRGRKEFLREVDGIRADYDFLATSQARKLALERLLQRQHDKTSADEAELNAGPEI
jgi:hypothetical protein